MTNGSGATQWPPYINALYQEDTTQLRFMKRQQWTITNYLLVLLAGVFGIVRAIHGIPGWATCVAIGMIVFAATVTIFLLLVIQDHMRMPRQRLATIYDYWDANERQKFNLTTTPTSWRRDLPFLIPLLLVCLFGAAIVSYAVAVYPASALPQSG